MRILTTLLAIALLLGCKKEESSIKTCHQEMKERFNSELRCSKQGEMEVNLYSGIYDGKRIYFTMIMCPACNTVPVQHGYTCDGQKISVENFNNTVSDIKQIYNSCTQKFMD